MGPVSLKDARKRLGDLVRAAEHGESVVITRRGKQVARIGPVSRPSREDLLDLSEFRATIKMKGKPLSDIVIEEREKGRY